MPHQSSVSFQLRLLHNAVKRKLIATYPLPLGEAATHLHGMILHFLAEQGERELFQKDVENEFRIRRSTASAVLKLMEKNGLIRREPVPQDARLKRLTLTEQARQIYLQMERYIQQVDEEITEGVPQEELDVFLRVLQKMQQNMEQSTNPSEHAGGAEHL